MPLPPSVVAGIVDPMFARLKECPCAILPIAALLSFVIGPSPSAAYARACDRLTKQRDAKGDADSRRKAPCTRQGAHRHSESDHPPTPKPQSISSFVAPKAAKPSGNPDDDYSPIAAVGDAFSFHPPRQGSDVVREQPRCLSKTHRPAYLAQAPPSPLAQIA